MKNTIYNKLILRSYSGEEDTDFDKRRMEKNMWPHKWKVMFFHQLLSIMDSYQLQWILDHDYPQWEKDLAKRELEKRLVNKWVE